MKDVLDELAAVHRQLRKRSLPAGEPHAVVLRRRYAAEIDDVWDAVTSAERLSRWFLPVSGDLRLTPGPAGDTEFELVHTAIVDEVFFSTYGPGATGVGWDLGLLGLALHLAGDGIGNPGGFESSPEAREFSRRSAVSWGEAHLAAGGDPAQVGAAVEATTTFYVSDPT
ncbi:hypothetical protein [Micromonospora inyonensis]|uniref:Activator of Hsp90 ATPase homolog 1-like protein n=1 Tax=Micromonospora inyonensis TaxID=47866 RepID=A0A1C6SLN8_9ACTN|nr:hypothetical protein [Micromonospora inyonensis]SCL30235.1 hypothetical protein GA0074694_5636 [Micromonospora inyonensis]